MTHRASLGCRGTRLFTEAEVDVRTLSFSFFVAFSPRHYPVDDYKELYPEDPYGAEAGENARVWRVYLDESAEFDSDMLRGYRDSLDVHLVFVRPSDFS